MFKWIKLRVCSHECVRMNPWIAVEPNEGVSHHDSSSLNSGSWLEFLPSHVLMCLSLNSPLFISCPPSTCSSTLPSPHYNISTLFLYSHLPAHTLSVSLSVCISLSHSHGWWKNNWKQRFFIEKMLRPVRWKALLIDLSSLHAHTRTLMQTLTHTHIASIVQCGCSHAHVHTPSLLCRGPLFWDYSAFHTVETMKWFPITVLFFLTSLSLSFFLSSSVPHFLSSSLHQFTTHLRHLRCKSILLYRSVAIISRIFSLITGNPPAGFFTIPAACLRLPQPISHCNV